MKAIAALITALATNIDGAKLLQFAPLGYQDFGAKNKERAAALNFRKRKRLASDQKTAKAPGLTYEEVAALAGCTNNTVRKAVIAGTLARVKVSHKVCRVMPEAAERFAKQYRATKGRA